MRIGSTPITDIKVGSTQITKVIRNGITYWELDSSWTPQNAPSELTVIAISGGHRLTWLDNTNNEEGFEIWVSINNAAYFLLAHVEANVVIYDDLVSTGVLSYRVRAYKNLENSQYSDIITINTSSYASETTALLVRMVVQPSTLLADLINKTIIDLKTANIWDELDCYWRFDLHTEQASLLNWKSTSFNCAKVSTPTWGAKQGFTGATSKYLRTFYNPVVNGVKATLLDNSMGIQMMTEHMSTTEGFFGSYGTYKFLLSKRSADNTHYAYDHSTLSIAVISATSLGLLGMRRLAGQVWFMRNGASVLTQVRTQDGTANAEIYLLYNGNAYCPELASSAFIGSSMTIGAGSKHEILNTINNYFVANVGVDDTDPIEITTTKQNNFKLTFAGTGLVSIDWGDGSSYSVFLSVDDDWMYHSYATAGSYTVLVRGQGLATIQADHGNITAVVIPAFFVNLKHIDFSYNVEIVELITHAEWVNLEYLNLFDCQLSSIGTYASWIKLYHISVYGNNLTSFVCYPEWIKLRDLDFASNIGITEVVTYNTWVLLEYVDAGECSLITFEAHREWVACFTLYVTTNQLTEAAVNSILIELDAIGASGYHIYLIGGGNHAPTGDGITAMNNLLGRSNEVQVNS